MLTNQSEKNWDALKSEWEKLGCSQIRMRKNISSLGCSKIRVRKIGMLSNQNDKKTFLQHSMVWLAFRDLGYWNTEIIFISTNQFLLLQKSFFNQSISQSSIVCSICVIFTNYKKNMLLRRNPYKLLFFGMFSHFHSFHLNLDPLHLHPPGPGGLVQDVLHEVANHLPLRQDLRQGLKRDSDYFHVHEPILGNIDWT